MSWGVFRRYYVAPPKAQPPALAALTLPPVTAKWDSANKGPDITLSGGDLTAANATANWNQVRSTISRTDKRYFEITVDGVGGFVAVGFCNSSLAMSGFWSGSTDAVFYGSDSGVYYNHPSTIAFLSTFTTGDVIGCAIDTVAGTVKFNKNGGAFSSDLTIPAPGIGGTVFAVISLLGPSAQATANFSPASPPAGYLTWNQEVTLDAVAGATTVTFSGSGSIVGIGALSGASSPAFTASGTLAGIGALAGTASPAFTASGALGGIGALAGTSTPAFSLSASLTGIGALSGSSSAAFTASGALSGVGSLSGASAVAFASSGALTGVGALSGSVSVAFALSGTLESPASATSIAGNISFGFTVAGTLAPDPIYRVGVRRVASDGVPRAAFSPAIARAASSRRVDRSAQSRRR